MCVLTVCVYVCVFSAPVLISGMQGAAIITKAGRLRLRGADDYPRCVHGKEGPEIKGGIQMQHQPVTLDTVWGLLNPNVLINSSRVGVLVNRFKPGEIVQDSTSSAV